MGISFFYNLFINLITIPKKEISKIYTLREIECHRDLVYGCEIKIPKEESGKFKTYLNREVFRAIST